MATHGLSADESRNPFSTRWVRPGAMEFLFPAGVDAPSLVARLAALDWRAALVGAHGSGKSTLLATLMPHLERAGRTTIAVALRAGNGRIPRAATRLAATTRQPVVLVVDGYEQLTWLTRTALRRRAVRSGWGLLATAHTPCDLPTLWTTHPTLETLLAIVQRQLPPHHGRIAETDVRRAIEQWGENLREALFSLYDLYESRR